MDLSWLELLLIIFICGWIGFFLRDVLLRWQAQERGDKVQKQLTQATRQATEIARALRADAAQQQKGLRTLQTTLDASRQERQASQGELSAARSVVGQLRQQVDALTSLLPKDQIKLLINNQARARLDDRNQQVETLQKELEGTKQNLLASRERQATTETHSRKLELRMEAAIRQEQETRKTIESLRTDLAASHEALFKCDKRVTARDAKIVRLTAKLGQLVERGVKPDSTDEVAAEAKYLTLLAEKDQRIGDLEKELERLDRHIGDLEKQVESAQPEPAPNLTSELAHHKDQLARLKKRLELRDRQFGGLVKELERLQQPNDTNEDASTPSSAADTAKMAAVESATVAEKDDLTEIRGIGPTLERMLNDLGVISFQQIASWDDAEIDRISAQLGRFRNRIRRDDWVGGAQKQADKKRAGA